MVKHVMLLRQGSKTLCCGRNTAGQLGLWHTNLVTKFIETKLCPQFTSFSQGTAFNAGICTNGHLWTCGSNAFGQLGLGRHHEMVTVFTKVPSNKTFVSVACGDHYMVVLDDSGAIWVCGNISVKKCDGIQKIEFLSSEDTPAFLFSENTFELSQIDSDNFFTFISAGELNFCAIDCENNLWGCGASYRNHLGPNIKINSVKNLVKLSNEKFKTVSCGYSHIAALRTDNSLWIHGDNTFKQLGSKKQLDDVRYFEKILCGNFCTVGLDENGTIWACGYGNNSLGFGKYKERNSWTQIGENFVTIKIIDNKNLAALDENQTLWFASDIDRTFCLKTYWEHSDDYYGISSPMRPVMDNVNIIDNDRPKKIKSSVL